MYKLKEKVCFSKFYIFVFFLQPKKRVSSRSVNVQSSIRITKLHIVKRVIIENILIRIISLILCIYVKVSNIFQIKKRVYIKILL